MISDRFAICRHPHNSKRKYSKTASFFTALSQHILTEIELKKDEAIHTVQDITELTRFWVRIYHSTQEISKLLERPNRADRDLFLSYEMEEEIGQYNFNYRGGDFSKKKI